MSIKKGRNRACTKIEQDSPWVIGDRLCHFWYQRSAALLSPAFADFNQDGKKSERVR
jgi:hypothetical protein